MITGRSYEYSLNVPTKKMCWYVLPSISLISARVGHSAVFVRNDKNNSQDGANSDGLVYLIGGADPSGVYNEMFALNIGTQTVEKVRVNNVFEGRYEHSCCYVDKFEATTGTRGEKSAARRGLLMWGGAVQSGNLNDLHFFDIQLSKWQVVAQKGEVPAARTCHFVSNSLENNTFAVFSGGEQGTLPVDDEHVHAFNIDTQTWSNLTIDAPASARRGSSPRSGRPKARQGHVSALFEGSEGASQCKLLVHGGLAGYTFFDDLWQFDVRKRTWDRITFANSGPSGRAAHAGALHNDSLYLFGGLTEHGASSELWKFELQSKQWTLMDMRGAVPAARLCFAMCLCLMPARVRKGQREPDEASMSSVNVSLNETMLVDAANNELLSLSARSNDDCAMSARLNELRLNDEFDEFSGPPSARSEESAGLCDSARSTSSQLRPALDESLYDRTLLPALFVHGGMNTEGDMFEDAYICVLP